MARYRNEGKTRMLSEALAAVTKVLAIVGAALSLYDIVSTLLSRDGAPIALEVLIACAGAVVALLIVGGAARLEGKAREGKNRDRGFFQLADIGHIHTLRLVTLWNSLKETPDLAKATVEMGETEDLPVESARFQFTIANLSRSIVTEKEHLVDPASRGGENGESSVERLLSDVEYDYRFTLKDQTSAQSWKLATWLFGDNGRPPEDFRYYYRFRAESNEVPAQTNPYRSDAINYPLNDDLHVVNHTVDARRVGAERVFGFHYRKRLCFIWDCDDSFIIYPVCLAGSEVRRARFKVLIQKELKDILFDNGGLGIQLMETVCSGGRPDPALYPASFSEKGVVTLGTETRTSAGAADERRIADSTTSRVTPLTSFCIKRDYCVFETPEIEVDPENVYSVIIKPSPKGSKALGDYIDDLERRDGADPVSGVTILPADPRYAGEYARLSAKVRRDMGNPRLFAVSDAARIGRKLSTSTFGYEARLGGKLAGFALFMVPGLDKEENLGYRIGLGDRELGSVMCVDSIAVGKEYRRRGLAREMLARGEEEGRGRGLRIFLATVAPGNVASLRNFEGAGYRAVGYVADLYGEGADRLIMRKDV